jgi:sterol desaturase/sphingolipid hydroxylase (fatty acid hydroxylase superfamily)
VNPELQRSLPWVWYPLVLSSSILLHLILTVIGIDLIYSTYIPVLLAAASITYIEIYFPYRDSWKPTVKDVVNDTSFMIAVQVLLPQLLGYTIAIYLITASDHQSSLWPRDLPNIVQVVVMILCADFLRYWLHRISHEWMPLWQLHAVHHSPDKLYWLNVGRFHPLEKILQFLFDALPFILLGVDPAVLSLYFVFYAVNGYFQHSNVDARFGWLNLIISSAELHRWHHSDIPEESNRNYGNNIIIWDLLFGTYFLPKERVVNDLGLKNKRYPDSFLKQMKTPFIPRLEKHQLPMISYKEILINLGLKIRLSVLYMNQWSKLMRSTKSPITAQKKLLKNILSKNKGSKFGLKFGFSAMASPQDYVNKCPISDYEQLKPYMDDASGQGLTIESASFYQVTSGTTGSAKYLPMTEAGLKSDKTLQNMVALSRYLDNPCTYTGKIFAVVSPAIEGHMASGVPFGSASGLTYMNMPYMARSKYVVPYPVFEIEDYSTKYFFIALFALAEPMVSMAATANPSTLVRLLEIINKNAVRLLDNLENGVSGFPEVNKAVMKAIRREFKPNSERAALIKESFSKSGKLSYNDIWPSLQQLVTWTGGSCGIALSSLINDLPASTDIVEMGYLASEVRGSITLGRDVGLPTFTNVFYEFIERDDWEADKKNTLLLDQLVKGKQYYVVITTVNGLYRYFMNDIVEVTGFYRRCPTIRFLQKGKGATNITGEKLYESQVLDAIKTLEGELCLPIRFQQWIADEVGAQYLVYLECDELKFSQMAECEDILERALCTLNMEFQQKRASGRLKPTQVKLLSEGAGECFKDFNLAKGQREGQYKALALIYLKDSGFLFDEHLRADG